MNEYKVLSSAKVYFEDVVEASDLTEAKKIAKNTLLNVDADISDPSLLPQDKYEIDKIERVELID